MRSKLTGLSVFILLAISAALLVACKDKHGFEISNLIIRETPPGTKRGVAYLSIQNNSDKALVLNYVHSKRTESIEVHRHLYEEGMMKMREVKHLNIDPNQRLDFTPGGYHLMLFGIAERFEEGQEVELTFEFEQHAPKTVVAKVSRL